MKRRKSSGDQTAPSADTPAGGAPTPSNDDGAALALQASDVQNARFHTARKGYHKGEVDDFLDRVEAAIDAKNARIAELEALAAAASSPAAAQATAPVPAPADVPATAAAMRDVAQPSAYGSDVHEPLPTSPVADTAASTADGSSGDGSFPPGWYADPWSQATYRYYDGVDWTVQTR